MAADRPLQAFRFPAQRAFARDGGNFDLVGIVYIHPNVTEEAKIFLAFQYPEVKDLCKQFLTLISGILVFSIAFSEKIIDFQRARLFQRLSLLVSWALLMISFVACGSGLYFIFIAAESANGSIIYNYGHDFKYFTRISYTLLDFAGVSFVAALLTLVFTALPNVLGKIKRLPKQ